MKTLTPSSKYHVLKILCSTLLLLAMIPGILAQEAASDEKSDILDKEGMNKINTVHDKSTPIMLNVVGGGARIHDLTVGRGGGNNVYNTAFGQLALFSNTSGDRNTAIGSYAMLNNTTGRYNTAIGRWTLYYNSVGSYNIALGVTALENNQTGNHNIAIGYETCSRNSSGYSNIGIGSSALYYSETKSNMVAVGDSALFNNSFGATTGSHAIQNTALGSKALFANTTGSWNTAAGYQALYSNNTGSDNTAFGQYSLQNNTMGTSNTAVGVWGLRSVVTGANNTAIGAYAGSSGGNYNQGTFVGRGAYPSGSNLINVTSIGYNSRTSTSNQLVLGNSAVTQNVYYGSFVSGSDVMFKNNIREEVGGLDFIMRLRPVTYTMDVQKISDLLQEDVEIDKDGNKTMGIPSEATLKARDEKSAIIYSGFIAQEVGVAAKESGYAFSGVIAPENDHDYYKLDYISLTVPIVKAIQEQQAQIEALSPEGIDDLQSELAALRAENLRMQGQINDILSMLEFLGVDQRQIPGYGTSESQQQSTSGNARLEQNTPNPFHENTLIRYFLPEGTHRAQIIITDMGGTQVMAFPLEHQGAGQVLIHGGTLPSGTYVYTLTINGRKVDSKRMVLL
jgi:trimeric autotransporter adhesin